MHLFLLIAKIYLSTHLVSYIIYKFTRSSAYLFILIFAFGPNIHTYLSTHLLVYVSTDLPENEPTCSTPLSAKIYLSIYVSFNISTDLPVRQPTCPVYFFSFRHITCILTCNSSTGLCTHRPTSKSIYPFILLLSFRLIPEAYLSIHLFIYIPIYASVHQPTRSFCCIHLTNR